MFRIAVVATLFLVASAANAAEFRWLNAWDRNFPSMSEMIDPYIKEVQALSGGSITINVSGPETVPPLEQFAPVQAGAFQFLYTHGAYHFGTSPLATVFEALNGDPKQLREAGMVDYLDQQYQKIGMKLVFAPMTPYGFYNIILRRPPTANGDLAGFKIRATPTYNALIRHLGATPVQLPPAEIYTSLDKRVVDGAAWGVIGPVSYKWFEVTKYMLRPSAGFNFNPVLMNLNAWKGLTAEQQKVLTEVGRKYEEIWYREAGRRMQDEEKTLIGHGMEIAQMSDAKKEKLKEIWSTGLWQLGLDSNGRRQVEEMRTLATSKGL